MDEEMPMTFVELMRIAELEGGDGEGGRQFMSLNPAFEPGGGSAFGGHVYAQSVCAASKTVEEGMVVHNVHGFFTLPGLADRPFVYNVSVLSSGRSYCTRYVTAKQPLETSSQHPFLHEDSRKELSKVVFACLVSFKKDEKRSDEESKTGHQMGKSVQERFRGSLLGLKPEMLERSPNIDTPWYWKHNAKYPQKQNFPGLEMRTVDMRAQNSSKQPSDWTNLTFYRAIGSIPPADYNLHACAHIYASDRNGMFLVSNAAGFGDEIGTIGSLSHSIVLHVPSKELLLKDGEWWIQEYWTPRSGQGRGVHESRIWDVSGKHVASTWQEGMVRRAEHREEQKNRLFWEEGMRRMGRPFDDETQMGGLAKHKL